MSSPKKPKPSFDVPAEVESAADSGWVYRSEKEPGEAQPTLMATEPAAIMSLAFAVMAQAITLGGMIATIPLALTLRTIEVIERPDR
jgi:hypothetical protein